MTEIRKLDAYVDETTKTRDFIEGLKDAKDILYENVREWNFVLDDPEAPGYRNGLIRQSASGEIIRIISDYIAVLEES